MPLSKHYQGTKACVSRVGFLSAALCLGSWLPAGAQSVARQVGDDIRWAASDAWAVWTAPLEARQRDWLTAAGAVGLSLAFLPVDDDIDRWAVRNAGAPELSFLRELRRGGALYGGSNVVPLVGGAYVVALATGNRNVRDGVFGCLVSYSSSSVVRKQVFYRLVSRQRPDTVKHRRDTTPVQPPAAHGDQYTFAFPGTDDWGTNAFPGGHIANLAACASFLTNRFDMGYVEPVIYGIAVGVGVGRLLDRGHWMSDQVMGSIFGYAVGREVAMRSRARARRDRQAGDSSGGVSSSGDRAFSITPSATGMIVRYDIRF
jgi:membrane-associated phospholipid phosphatase